MDFVPPVEPVVEPLPCKRERIDWGALLERQSKAREAFLFALAVTLTLGGCYFLVIMPMLKQARIEVVDVIQTFGGYGMAIGVGIWAYFTGKQVQRERGQ